MDKTLTYLFDPLCGWCYGASGSLSSLVSAAALTLELVPTGLFSGGGARFMDDAFAAYAWTNDLRIARLTGQPFSDAYRERVLADRTQAFDSGPATVALTCVALIAPERELEALKAIQHARYVEGRDITRLATLVDVLDERGLAAAARRLNSPDEELLEAVDARITRGRALLTQTGKQAVPAFLLKAASGYRVLPAGAIFSNPGAFAQELREAA